jgi:short-subunit dehydrogenase
MRFAESRGPPQPTRFCGDAGTATRCVTVRSSAPVPPGHRRYTAAMRRIFITGASSGLGDGLARRLAGANVTLGLVARRKEVLGRLAEELRGVGATVHDYAADVADTSEMKRIASAFVASAGGVDLVVANAGVRQSGRHADQVTELAKLLQVNVIGVTNTIVPFVPAMVAQRSGVLVAIASVAGFRALPGRTGYSTSKAAVITFMDGLRMELAGTGVHAFAVCPGFIATPMTASITHRAPFMLTVDQAVDEILRALERRPKRWIFPWQMRVLVPLLRLAPEWLVTRLSPPPSSD